MAALTRLRGNNDHVNSVTRILTCEEATAAMAGAVAALLEPGDVVALSGEMGAGKTTFVRQLAAALGVGRGLVSSPTFVLINQYPTPPEPKGLLAGGELVHVDAYRVSSIDDLQPAGWERLFDASSGAAIGNRAAIIEWPERIADALPADLIRVRLVALEGDTREFTITPSSRAAARPAWKAITEREPRRCPKTGRWVTPTNPAYPFADAKARDADLLGWMNERYSTSRQLSERDLDPPE